MNYLRPKSLDECLGFLRSEGGNSPILLAGGTDLMPRYERGRALPGTLIDLKHIDELRGITTADDSIRIGSMTTIQEIQDHGIIRESFTALQESATDFAGAQIRHRGTIGGNIINASPAGDLLPPLYAFNASLECQGVEGERMVPLREFIRGPGQTRLKQGELLIAVHLELTNCHSRFIKIGLREAMAISVVNLAILRSDDTSDPDELIVAAGAVAPTVVVLNEFGSAYLAGNRDWDGLSGLIDKQIAPIDDVRASASYRRKVLKNMIRDALTW